MARPLRSRAPGMTWTLVATLAALLAAARPAGAVIAIPTAALDKSKTILVARIEQIDAATGVITVKMAEAVRGQAAADSFRLRLTKSVDLLKSLAVGQPLVLMNQNLPAKAVIHVGDAWVLANLNPAAQSPVWIEEGPHLAWRESFPGRTVALVRLLAEFKPGATKTLLSKAENKLFPGGAREVAKLAVERATSIAAADVNGDKRPDLLVAAPKGAKLFLAMATGYEDATDRLGLANAVGDRAAVGDVNADGKIDLFLGGNVWIGDGRKFAATPVDLPKAAKVIAVALADVTGDAKPDALVLLATGEVRTFENPGAAGQWGKQLPSRQLAWEGAAPVAAAFGDFGDTGKPHVLAVGESGITRYALDADGGPPAGYERLTGQKLDAHHKGWAGGLKNAAATVLDVNGDKRPDYFVVADGASALLVNRGFGAFLVVPDAGAALTAAKELKFSPATPWCAADVAGDGFEDLLVLGEDGRLFLMENAPPAPQK